MFFDSFSQCRIECYSVKFTTAGLEDSKVFSYIPLLFFRYLLSDLSMGSQYIISVVAVGNDGQESDQSISVTEQTG